MGGHRLIWGICLALASAVSVDGQGTVSSPRSRPDPPRASVVALTVPSGAAIQIALDKEVRVRKVGQFIRGRVVQPVYSFDRLVIPAGTRAIGQITKIDRVSAKKRVLAVLNADFTPARKVEIEFDELALPDGRNIPVHTFVAPGSGQVIEIVSASEDQKRKTATGAASGKLHEAKETAKREWQNAMKQVKGPGKLHRLERYVIARLPLHPQYIDAGTTYIAELREPLGFGSEPLTPRKATATESLPSGGSLVHALLVTPLNSATTQKGAEVKAVISQPVFRGEQLALPQGSILEGSVVQVQPARSLKRNGELRIMFRELVPPNGMAQKMVASVEGVQADKWAHVKLDSESGAKATSPATRYMAAAVSLGLGVASFGGDADDWANHSAGGAGGFKLLGLALGATVKSRALGYSMGAYGAGVSVYSRFIARGRNVVFSKNTAMLIELEPPETSAPAKSAKQSTPDSP